MKDDILQLAKCYLPSYQEYGKLDWALKFSSEVKDSKICFRRLSAIADYEGKTRIIAIGD